MVSLIYFIYPSDKDLGTFESITLSLSRSMVLQNESIDSDLEHFEDIEETDNEPLTPSKKEEANDEVVLADHQDGANSNSGSLEEDDDSPEDMDDTSTSYSQDDDSDEAEGLLLKDDSKDFSESRRLPRHNGVEFQVSATRSTLPGGYIPRHREPSYWYFSNHILSAPKPGKHSRFLV